MPCPVVYPPHPPAQLSRLSLSYPLLCSYKVTEQSFSESCVLRSMMSSGEHSVPEPVQLLFLFKLQLSLGTNTWTDTHMQV